VITPWTGVTKDKRTSETLFKTKRSTKFENKFVQPAKRATVFSGLRVKMDLLFAGTNVCIWYGKVLLWKVTTYISNKQVKCIHYFSISFI